MMIEIVDFAWSMVLLVVAVAGIWWQIKHSGDVRKTWYIHAFLCIGWVIGALLSYLDGDGSAWVLVCILTSALCSWNWFWQQDRAKELYRQEQEREKARREVFEAFRIDDLPKN